MYYARVLDNVRTLGRYILTGVCSNWEIRNEKYQARNTGRSAINRLNKMKPKNLERNHAGENKDFRLRLLDTAAQ